MITGKGTRGRDAHPIDVVRWEARDREKARSLTTGTEESVISMESRDKPKCTWKALLRRILLACDCNGQRDVWECEVEWRARTRRWRNTNTWGREVNASSLSVRRTHVFRQLEARSC
jgi:hypothetical protein